ncbi:hypothetical protein [Actinokineospora sp. NBRC 105648]|uniref:hypothetical protein n=1 Tax=Actinokineospora sp. NBRC 105648 TaxID=3032206 RepID=UPI0024A57162|nr:hypothetical protein [Actinokineospora sp. NBRC 105648]GLZ42256.1 hypothetical protein Acsp05_58800 [Actinokineospora sp. NBRC 105648]
MVNVSFALEAALRLSLDTIAYKVGWWAVIWWGAAGMTHPPWVEFARTDAVQVEVYVVISGQVQATAIGRAVQRTVGTTVAAVAGLTVTVTFSPDWCPSSVHNVDTTSREHRQQTTRNTTT